MRISNDIEVIEDINIISEIYHPSFVREVEADLTDPTLIYRSTRLTELSEEKIVFKGEHFVTNTLTLLIERGIPYLEAINQANKDVGNAKKCYVLSKNASTNVKE